MEAVLGNVRHGCLSFPSRPASYPFFISLVKSDWKLQPEIPPSLWPPAPAVLPPFPHALPSEKIDGCGLQRNFFSLIIKASVFGAGTEL